MMYGTFAWGKEVPSPSPRTPSPRKLPPRRKGSFIGASSMTTLVNLRTYQESEFKWRSFRTNRAWNPSTATRNY